MQKNKLKKTNGGSIRSIQIKSSKKDVPVNISGKRNPQKHIQISPEEIIANSKTKTSLGVSLDHSDTNLVYHIINSMSTLNVGSNMKVDLTPNAKVALAQEVTKQFNASHNKSIYKDVSIELD